MSHAQFEQWIIDALAGENLTGFEILRKIAVIHGEDGQVERTLYPLLHKLESDGTISVEMVGEPPRRTYSLLRSTKTKRIELKELKLERQNG